MDASEPQRCPEHPETETYLTCSNCGRPICPLCMMPTAVGAKCADCARHRGRTARHAKPIYYARAVGAALGAGMVGGFLLSVVTRAVAFGAIILTFLAALAMGAIVSWAARRNTGPYFQVIAGAGAALMFFLAGFFTGSPITLLLALLGIYLAAARLKD